MAETNNLYGSVIDILKKYRADAYQAINTAMVISYWQIGKAIVENEQGGNAKASYGDEVLQSLSKKLTADFGKGFSYSNLRNFRQFYLTYQDEQICYAVSSKLKVTDNQLNEISYALRSNLSWTHHRGIILCTDKEETVVKYSMLNDSKQLFASKYQMYLPTEKQLADWVDNDKAIIEAELRNQGDTQI